MHVNEEILKSKVDHLNPLNSDEKMACTKS